MINNPKVSVCMITYNHEKFIEEAMNGVLMQKCDFEVELIVANDCSSDKTDEVIQKIIKSHPRTSIIKYFKHEQNIGMMPNFIFALKQCTGKYIALCDGDDYWTNSLKLQKQVDFMEFNLNYSACFHNAIVINESNSLNINFCDWNLNKRILKKDIILKGGGIFPTASLLFRNKIQLPKFTVFTRAGDSALAFALLEFGEFYYLKDKMCVYRKHIGGVYTSHMNNMKINFSDIKSNIKLLINFREFYNSKFKLFFDSSIQNQLKRVSNNFGFNQVLLLLIKRNISLMDFNRFVKYKLKK